VKFVTNNQTVTASEVLSVIASLMNCKIKATSFFKNCHLNWPQNDLFMRSRLLHYGLDKYLINEPPMTEYNEIIRKQ
jgi:hypothetical protein